MCLNTYEISLFRQETDEKISLCVPNIYFFLAAPTLQASLVAAFAISRLVRLGKAA